MLFPVLLVLLCIFAGTAVRAFDVRNESYLLSSQEVPSPCDLGLRIATQGDTVLVSAPSTGGKNREGIVYEFTNVNGKLTQRSSFTSQSVQMYDQFGASLQLLDDVAVVGAPEHNSKTGAAYVFKRSENGWNEVQELTSKALHIGAKFGSAVAMSAERIVVGAPYQDSLSPWTFVPGQGIFVIFDLKDGVWTEVVAYMPSHTVEGSFCGRTLAVSGDLVFVNCLTDKDETKQSKNKDTGVVYVYQVAFGGQQSVRELQRLTGVGSAGEYFGSSLSVVASGSQTLLYVGAAEQYELEQYHGSVSIFSQGNVKDTLNTTASLFSLTTRLTPPADTARVRYFGYALQVRGDHLVVGAHGSQNAQGENYAGLGYYYKREGQQWVLSAKLQKATSEPYDRLGLSAGLVGSQGDTVILGTGMCNSNVDRTGVVAVYNF